MQDSSSQTPAPSSQAPERALPSKSFYSVEYPGYVRPTSVPTAIGNLGGQSSLNNAFKRTATKSDSLLELRLRPDNPFAHPIPGENVPTNNILLKVVKRKRKKLNPAHDEEGQTHVGDYKVEAVGVVSKTVRFRSMADFQYQPDAQDPVVKLRNALDKMDIEGIRSYTIPEEKEDYTTLSMPEVQIDPQLTCEPGTEPKIVSNLRMFPPPLFSRQSVPQNYGFKANPMSTVTTFVDDNGEEKKRLINRTRWKGYGPVSIVFSDPTVPEKPIPQVEEARQQVDQHLLRRVEQYFEQRPVWTRLALLNQFTAGEARDIHNSKALLPLVSYTFSDGPWRDTLIRLGYDPRKDVGARFYQRLYFRNVNHPIVRPSVITRRHDGRSATIALAPADEGQRSHIFDGVTLTKDTAAFQLCDIHDRLLKEMIEDEDDLRETVNERDGWYTTHAFENIKTILRHKFFSLVDGYVATDEECLALLSSEPGAARPAPVGGRKVRWGRHNMAKGALAPEDAAAIRLRAALEQNRQGQRSS
ncbi:hypothetical protein GLOTRDRAFT_70737 [Gloeophyllum trabeum ATCC 11539]|uniref:Transcription factor IIIC subunit 5 HTH domain-containing protein n=1 Tax=Gloeophyllum trabeum (strain ATCC 11539 / FP-39264 / Madison 617) TaxID=670483 RepID=S7QHX1_GLOTA|nr:uncharacterized protein GLOTRDRAFT_70737 [Gloeophyllum trabeum ATCC 11539]EPQ59371.1 hypothetical protein GLOTRDRAFT_70737 [Gloeophyllum trabeum ATCC 11539]